MRARAISRCEGGAGARVGRSRSHAGGTRKNAESGVECEKRREDDEKIAYPYIPVHIQLPARDGYRHDCVEKRHHNSPNHRVWENVPPSMCTKRTASDEASHDEHEEPCKARSKSFHKAVGDERRPHKEHDA